MQEDRSEEQLEAEINSLMVKLHEKRYGKCSRCTHFYEEEGEKFCFLFENEVGDNVCSHYWRNKDLFEEVKEEELILRMSKRMT